MRRFARDTQGVLDRVREVIASMSSSLRTASSSIALGPGPSTMTLPTAVSAAVILDGLQLPPLALYSAPLATSVLPSLHLLWLLPSLVFAAAAAARLSLTLDRDRAHHRSSIFRHARDRVRRDTRGGKGPILHVNLCPGILNHRFGFDSYLWP